MGDGAAVGKWYKSSNLRDEIRRFKSEVGVSKGRAESCRKLQGCY